MSSENPTAANSSTAPDVLEFDDDDLVRLGSPGVIRLFTALDRARSMSSLIVVLAFMPALYVMYQRSLTEADAEWGLKAMTVLVSEDASSWLDPRGIETGVPFRHQPPLSTWLTAAAMRLLGTSWPVSHIVVSYLAVVGSVIVLSRLVAELIGERTAMIAAAVAATHVWQLQWVQSASPVAVSVLLGLLTVLQFVRHARYEGTVVSLKLLSAGIAMGLCALASGIWALWVAVTALVMADIASRREPGGWDRSRRPPGMILAWGVLLLTAFAFGGWWFLMMTQSDGLEWLSAQWRESVVSDRSGVGPARWLRMFGGGLIGLLVIGGLRAIRLTMKDSQSKREVANCPDAALFWLGLSCVFYLLDWSIGVSGGLIVSLSATWLALSATATIAWTINEIAEARLGTMAALGAGVLGLLSLLLTREDMKQSGSADSVVPFAMIVIVIAAIAAGIWASNRPRVPGDRRRILVGTLLVTLLVGQMLSSISTLRAGRAPYLDTLRSMAFSPPVVDAVCVSDTQLPARMRLTLRSLNEGEPVENRNGLQQLRQYLAEHVSSTIDEAVLMLEATDDDGSSAVDIANRRVLIATWANDLEITPVIRQLGWAVEQDSSLRMIGDHPFQVRVVSWHPDVPSEYLTQMMASGSEHGSDVAPEVRNASADVEDQSEPSVAKLEVIAGD